VIFPFGTIPNAVVFNLRRVARLPRRRAAGRRAVERRQSQDLGEAEIR
jgi:hypothetical protein